MLSFDFAWIPVIVLAVVNFFLSWIWYSPLLFARPWMKALGLNPDRKMSDMTEEEKKQMPVLFAGGIFASFAFVIILAVLVASTGARDFVSGAGLGLLVWIGFALTHSLNTMWEGRKTMVLVINNGLYILTYTIFGGVLAVWQ